MVNRLFLLHGVYVKMAGTNVLEVAIETMGAGGKTIRQQIEREMARRGVHMPLIDLPVTQASKDQRISWSLEPPYNAGIVYHQEGLKGSEFEEALLRFPKGRKKDLIDAYAYAMDRARKTGHFRTRPDDEITGYTPQGPQKYSRTPEEYVRDGLHQAMAGDRKSKDVLIA